MSRWTPELCADARFQVASAQRAGYAVGVKHWQKLLRKHHECDAPSQIGRASTSTSPTEPMPSLLSAVGNALVADPGRANTSAPDTTGNSGLLSTVGTILGGLVGVPGVGNALGTIGDSVLASTTTTTASATPGRAVAQGVLTGSGTVMSRAGQALSFVTGQGVSMRTMGLTGLPRGTARMARLLTKWDGVTSAANALGLSVEQTAWLALRPVRRRGITAASLRTTRRTIRQVHSITRSFKKLKAC